MAADAAVTTLEIDGLLQPTLSQHEYIERALRTMSANELREVLLHLVEFLGPVERSALLELAAELGHGRPFRDGTRAR